MQLAAPGNATREKVGERRNGGGLGTKNSGDLRQKGVVNLERGIWKDEGKKVNNKEEEEEERKKTLLADAFCFFPRKPGGSIARSELHVPKKPCVVLQSRGLQIRGPEIKGFQNEEQ